MIVFFSACFYWFGVAVNAIRIRVQTGRTPSVRPRTALDRVIWAAWIAMIVLWTGTPWFLDAEDHFFDSRAADFAGIALAGAGFLGTWWCYVSMGTAWAISQNKKATNKLVRSGPFGLVRHPIYALQWLIVAGMFLVSPGWTLLVALVLLSACMQVKARAEERGLREVFGVEYDEYCKEVGRFFPF